MGRVFVLGFSVSFFVFFFFLLICLLFFSRERGSVFRLFFFSLVALAVHPGSRPCYSWLLLFCHLSFFLLFSFFSTHFSFPSLLLPLSLCDGLDPGGSSTSCLPPSHLADRETQRRSRCLTHGDRPQAVNLGTDNDEDDDAGHLPLCCNIYEECTRMLGPAVKRGRT